MSTLTFTYDRDPNDDFSRLRVSVHAPPFAGSGQLWVQWQDLEEFAQALAAYPIETEAPPRIECGYEGQAGYRKLMAVEIIRADAKGNLTARLFVADEDNDAHQLSTSFETNYPDVQRFAESLLQVAKGEVHEALLLGR